MAERPEFQSGLFKQGKQIRGEVAGADHLDRMLAKADDFSAPIQQLVTEYCWGFVWGRDGLERKTRSMLNLAMLAALGRGHEFKLHCRGALRNGVSRDEIREIIMQIGIYCGVPAMMESTRLAQEVFVDVDAGTRRRSARPWRDSGARRRTGRSQASATAECQVDAPPVDSISAPVHTVFRSSAEAA